MLDRSSGFFLFKKMNNGQCMTRLFPAFPWPENAIDWPGSPLCTNLVLRHFRPNADTRSWIISCVIVYHHARMAEKVIAWSLPVVFEISNIYFLDEPLQFMQGDIAGFTQSWDFKFGFQAWKSHGIQDNIFRSWKSHEISDFCFIYFRLSGW